MLEWGKLEWGIRVGYYRGYTHKYTRRQYQGNHQPSVRCLFFIEEDTKDKSFKETALMDVLAVTAFIVVVVPTFSFDKILLLLLLVVMDVSEGITGVAIAVAVASDQSVVRRR